MGGDFLTAYQRYAGQVTDACPDYHRFMALGVISACLGNKVYLPWGDSRIYCNMWMILLGKSTIDRKSTSLMIAKKLIDNFDRKMIYPNEFSYERIVETFANRPSGAFFFSEFMTFMKLLAKEYMGPARSFLADMYDAPYRYERELQSKTFVIEYPAPSIFAATTTDWFIGNISESDIAAGLIPRFMIIPATTRAEMMPRPPKADLNLREELLEFMTKLNQIEGVAYFTKEAAEIHDQWYRQIWSRNHVGNMIPFIGRLQGHLLKFSMMFEANRTYKMKISAESMREAVHAVQWLYKNLKVIESDEMVFGKTNLDIKKIKEVLKDRGGVVTRRDLSRGTHLTVWQIDQAIETMEERGEVRVEQKKNQKGLPSQIYHKT